MRATLAALHNCEGSFDCGAALAREHCGSAQDDKALEDV